MMQNPLENVSMDEVGEAVAKLLPGDMECRVMAIDHGHRVLLAAGVGVDRRISKVRAVNGEPPDALARRLVWSLSDG
jgi:hypothetical protein